jgi:hypothetical protein
MSIDWVIVPSPATRDSGFRLAARTITPSSAKPALAGDPDRRRQNGSSWKHNWKECPEEIEVVQLSRIFGI